MMKKEISIEMDRTITNLVELLSAFDKEQVNTVPFKGSWTAGQLAEHLVKSNSGFLEMINGPVAVTERAPDKQVQHIKTNFLDFTIKMKSPDFVVPVNTCHRKEELLNTLKRIKSGLMEAIETLDLTQTCTAFELPFYGFLTRLEAVYFIIYHTQRHTRQLRNIQKKLVI